ncbi:17345_t:CDS:2, partial [Dentiscutata erythropus]
TYFHSAFNNLRIRQSTFYLENFIHNMALQTLWNRNHALIVDSSKAHSNKFKVEYIGSGKGDSDSATIRTNQPIPSQQDFYFEAKKKNKEVPKKDIIEEALAAARKEEEEFTSSVKEGDNFKEIFDMENFDVLPFLAANKESIKTVCTSLLENNESLTIVKEWARNTTKNFEKLTRTSGVDKRAFSNILTLLNKFLNEESCEINKKNEILEHILELVMFETDKSAANVDRKNEKSWKRLLWKFWLNI